MGKTNFYMGDTFEREGRLSDTLVTACNCYNDGYPISMDCCDSSISAVNTSLVSPIYEVGVDTTKLDTNMTKLTADVNRMKEALGLVGESIEKMSFKNGLWGRLRRNQLKTMKER